MSKQSPKITNLYALELFGAMIGDGCLSRYFASYNNRYLYVVLLTGNAKKEFEYHCYLSGLLSKLFDVKCKPRVRKNSSNTVILTTSTKHVFDWFLRNKFPCGKKLNISIPPNIMALPNDKLNRVIRGIFDTDGQISARKDEDYKYPYIFICSSSKILLQQIKSILRRQGLTAYIHADNVVIRGLKNFKIWIKLIGSSNQRNLERFKELQKTGRLQSVGS